VKSATNVIPPATVTRNNPVVSPDVGTRTTGVGMTFSATIKDLALGGSIDDGIDGGSELDVDVALDDELDVALDVVLDALDVEFDGVVQGGKHRIIFPKWCTTVCVCVCFIGSILQATPPRGCPYQIVPS